MSYRFPLQKVLDYKEKEKQQAQQELGSSLQKKQVVEQGIQQLYIKKEQTEDRLFSLNKGYKASELHHYHQYMNALNQQIISMQGQLKRAQKDVERKQSTLMEKARDEKVWHEWKIRLFEQDRQEQQKKEQEMLDEMASIRYFRQQGLI